jgi:hypothetical protein
MHKQAAAAALAIALSIMILTLTISASLTPANAGWNSYCEGSGWNNMRVQASLVPTGAPTTSQSRLHTGRDSMKVIY